MVTKVYNKDNNYSCSKEGVIYFDIETTGFDKENDRIMLISYGKMLEGEFVIKQIFADRLNEEKDLLINFLEDIREEHIWCSYNGIAFDEPFIRKRMQLLDIDLNLPEEHIDLYRLIRPYQKSLNLERCNLKTVEKYLGINRRDKIDGGISVGFYSMYLETGDMNLKNAIMLHNYEDVLNLPDIHKFAAKMLSDPDLVRDDVITAKQRKYLEALLRENGISLRTSVEKLSKRAASKMINSILNGTADSCELELIANNSY
ncbi:MAG: ribonuclease H-like domain-containing protein [Clostridiaceae bacterium]